MAWRFVQSTVHCGNNIVVEVQQGDTRIVYRRSNYHPQIQILSRNGQKLTGMDYTCTGETDAEVQENFWRFLDNLPVQTGG